MTNLCYTFVGRKSNKILFRGYKDGKRIQSGEIAYKPSLYTPLESGAQSDYQTIYGEPLKKIEFSSIRDANNFIRDYKDVFRIHGNTQFEYDFLHSNFPDTINASIEDINVVSVDIETKVTDGEFPNPELAKEEITVITIIDRKTKKVTALGTLAASHDGYTRYATESEMLLAFIDHIRVSDPDIITGWNVDYFDFAYLCTRINNVLGESAMERLSPFGEVRKKIDVINEREQMRFEIVGRTILDMMDLYKKFRLITRASYKLDYIAEIELGENKVSNPYGSFREFYEKDPQLFLQYNIHDAMLVDRLETKLGFVYLSVVLAYLTKCNFADVFSPVKMWENYITSILKNENTFVARKSMSNSGFTPIEGGYVKQPVPGIYEWLVSLDFGSLYPSIIMALNMSPETLIDYDPEFTVDEFLAGKYVADSDKCLAVNGTTYRKDKLGVVPRLTKVVFDLRKSAKKEMLSNKRMYEETHDIKYKAEADRLNVLQQSAKVLGNALYGSLSNEYFMFFDTRIAEGVTKTGQYLIRKSGKELSDYVNKLVGTDSVDYNVYSDTDSCYIVCNSLVEKYLSSITDEQKIVDALDKIVKNKLQVCVDAAIEDAAKTMNVYENVLTIKREAISSSAVWVAKKRYAQRVLDNEDVRYSEPEYKVTGIETNRSSTPDLVRGWLMDAIKIMLDTNDVEQVKSFVDKCRTEFTKKRVEEISFPRGVNNLAKWQGYPSGTPIAVRAAMLHNDMVKKKNLTGKVREISEGDKIKYTYLIEPNPLRANVIGFVDELPQEFGLHRYVDYDKQFDKAFFGPLKNITDAASWKLVEEAVLEGFF
jgi:DNA polymerase elongation subunit (family B)